MLIHNDFLRRVSGGNLTPPDMPLGNPADKARLDARPNIPDPSAPNWFDAPKKLLPDPKGDYVDGGGGLLGGLFSGNSGGGGMNLAGLGGLGNILGVGV